MKTRKPKRISEIIFVISLWLIFSVLLMGDFTTAATTITDNSLDVGGNLTLTDKITFTFAEVIDNLVNGWIKITGGLNVTDNVEVGENVTASYFIGNGSQLTSVAGATDTNESIRFNALVGNCSVGQLVFGIDSDGTKVCLTDSGSFDNTNIAYYNESGNFTRNLNLTQNISSVDYVFANFFQGIYNWIIGAGVSTSYLSFNGTDLTFDETKLNATIDNRVIPDTNESSRFNILTNTDCPAGQLVIGVESNGSVLCAVDDTSFDNTNLAYVNNSNTFTASQQFNVNINITGNITARYINANFFVGSGSLLTGITGSQISDDGTFLLVTGDTGTGNFIFNQNLTVDTNTLFVNSDLDRVGIGTTSPGTELEVEAGSGVTSVRITARGGGAGSSTQYIVDKDAGSRTNWRTGAQLNVADAYEITPSTIVGGTIFTTPALVILNTGRVGIGTTNPGSKLVVKGASGGLETIISIDADDDGRVISMGKDASDDGFIEINDGSQNIDIKFNTDGFSWFNGGNLGIGTATPKNTLNVIGDVNFTGLIYGNGSQLTSLPVGSFTNTNIAYYNESGNFTRNLNLTQNISSVDYVFANFFRGIYNWIIGAGVSTSYLTFNGTDLTFDETKLNATIDDRVIPDTNESDFILNLSATDCAGGTLVIGVQANGSVLCAVDGGSFTNTNIAYYNESGNFTRNLNLTQNISSVDYVFANFFQGIYNWIIGAGVSTSYLTFNGTDLTFDDSQLNTTIDARLIPFDNTNLAYYNESGNFTTHQNVTGNLTASKFLLGANSSRHYIYDNGTCTFVVGSTAIFRVC